MPNTAAVKVQRINVGIYDVLTADGRQCRIQRSERDGSWLLMVPAPGGLDYDRDFATKRAALRWLSGEAA